MKAPMTAQPTPMAPQVDDVPNRLICRDDSWLEAYQNDSRSFEGWELPPRSSERDTLPL